MATSVQNGNRQHFLLFVILSLIFALIVFLIAELMLFDGVRTGKYKDPQLATKVISGTIYDSEGSALAISIPSYDLVFEVDKISNIFDSCKIVANYTDTSLSLLQRKCKSLESGTLVIATSIPQDKISQILSELSEINPSDAFKIEKNTKRTYPSNNHAGDLIIQLETNLDSVLKPRPGFNETITYGSSIELTIINEVQYLLDIAISSLYEARHFEYYAMVIDYETGSILGMTTTPFENPSISRNIKSLAYIPELKFENSQKIIKPYFISEIDGQKVNIDMKKLGFQTAEEEMYDILNGNFGSYNISRFPNRDNPKYVLLICCSSFLSTETFENAAYQIYNGLMAQGRL